MFNNKYAKYYDLFNNDKDYKKEIEFVYEWANRPRNTLDVGCGTARYWQYWPSGKSIIGVERSREMIAQSKYSALIMNHDIQKDELKHNDFDLVMALFDVINYIPKHDWWSRLPIKKGGYFIFDIWDKAKVSKEGFKRTVKTRNDTIRVINPLSCDDKKVTLKIHVLSEDNLSFSEEHTMYLFSHSDIEKFCGQDFEIRDIKKTKKWQTWYKLRKK